MLNLDGRPNPIISPSGENQEITELIQYLDAKICPKCGASLIIDEQPESVFAYCNFCADFDVSVHMDMETKEVVLAYASTTGPQGFVDPFVLKQLENALVRKEYTSSTT